MRPLPQLRRMPKPDGEQLELKKKQDRRKRLSLRRQVHYLRLALLNGINILNAARSAPPPFNIPISSRLQR